MSEKLVIKGLTKKFSKTDGVENINLTVKERELLTLLGPSGCGKTTILRAIGGFHKIDSGKILLDGKDVSAYKGYCPIQMIWQQPELAVNPRLPMRAVLEEGDEIEERIIRGLGIEQDWLNRFPSELSGGEMQRFCIARALGKRTRFLIADEISTMLDLITQSQIWNFLLKEVEAREIGLIAVSHSQPLLDRICTRQIPVGIG